MINWIMEYLFSFAEVFLSFIFCEAFFDKKVLKANKVSYLCIALVLAALIITLNSVQLFSLVNTVIFFVLYCFASKFLFKTSWLKVIGVELTYFFLLFILDTTIMTAAAQISGISAAEVESNFSSARIAGGIGTKILLATICIGINRLLDKNKAFNRKAYALGFGGTVILIVLSAVIYYKLADNTENNGMVVLLFFFMLALFFSTFIAFMFFLDSQRKKQENELILQQNQFLERSLTEQENTFFMWRKSIHDYKSTILALDLYIEQNRLNDLFDHIHREKEKFARDSHFFRTGNSAVDTIINTKHTTAQKNGIAFSVNARLPEKCAVSDIHLATMIGNLLDNAIEAQENELEPFVRVNISIEGDLLIINIINKCSEPLKSGKTSKKDKQFHGIGLKSVDSTARQYGGDFSLYYENETAAATVVIPNKQKNS